MRKLLVCISFCLSSVGAVAATIYPPLQGPVELIVLPNEAGHTHFINAIENARSSIVMTMYHLTDQAVIDALHSAAQNGVKVQLILDSSNFTNAARAQNLFNPLTQVGVEIRQASKGFSISHVKAMVVDNETAFVTSINMTNTATNTRDLGIITVDPSVIAEINSVFATDWQNAESGQTVTPQLSQTNLLWSPVNSAQKLMSLIDSATDSIEATVENVGDSDLDDSLIAAAARGVKVQIILPECNYGNALYNYPFLTALSQGQVQVRVMPVPYSFNSPYMHSKMILADHQSVYIGSENFSYNSLMLARELGILLSDQTVTEQVDAAFQEDWNRAIVPPQNPSASLCPAFVPHPVHPGKK